MPLHQRYNCPPLPTRPPSKELASLLEGPSKPRDDPPPILLNPIEELPVMQLFKHHLSNFEGSNRKPSDAKEHVRRVCRLLYEVDLSHDVSPCCGTTRAWTASGISSSWGTTKRKNHELPRRSRPTWCLSNCFSSFCSHEN